MLCALSEWKIIIAAEILLQCAALFVITNPSYLDYMQTLCASVLFLVTNDALLFRGWELFGFEFK